ncbi:MAG: hypothetical protein MZV70_71795 [Desulfobacterales bacterium]|nr:hypothetical protein [Desulfobacterales bacterium]
MIRAAVCQSPRRPNGETPKVFNVVCPAGHLGGPHHSEHAIFSAFSVKTIPYSEFLKALNEDRVTEVAITANHDPGPHEADGRRHGAGQTFRTMRVDPDLSELLSRPQRRASRVRSSRPSCATCSPGSCRSFCSSASGFS